MIHPYTGERVQCDQVRADAHSILHATELGFDHCPACGDVLMFCRPCAALIECCSCGMHHALSCSWPL
jgi:hypothetical protein